MFLQAYTYYIQDTQKFLCVVLVIRDRSNSISFCYDLNEVGNGKHQGMKVQGPLGCCEKHKRKEGDSLWSPQMLKVL